MITLEGFIKSHGRAAMRIAKTDEEFNECLVLQFRHFMDKYDPEIGTPEGWVLLQLRYAVMKYRYKERLWMERHGRTIPVDTTQPKPHTSELRKALNKLPKELREVIDLWAYGYTQRQISSELGVGIRKVRHRTYAAIDQLKEMLTDEVRAQLDK
jgi:DNA-directed RNA polymerase specialized sigma24 family protein